MGPGGQDPKALHIHIPRAVIGLVIGFALGLTYTWGINPAELTNTYPALLRTDYRLEWVRLAALSYVADGDIERARARLDGLKHEDVASALQALIEESATAGRRADTLRSLTTLAQALDVHTSAMLVYLHTPASSSPSLTYPPTPSPTSTPPPTYTPTPYVWSPLLTPTHKPTRTPRPPTPTPASAPLFQFIQKEQICIPGQSPRIEVIVRDERGAQLPGVEIWLMWPGGADRAITGLKPESGKGYADFNVEQSAANSANHTLGVSELGMPLVTDLQIVPCPSQKGKEPIMGSWRVVLEKRSPETD